MSDETIEISREAGLIAQELIAEVHTHLQEANILYLFTDKRRTKDNRVILGTAKRAGKMERFLSGESVDGEVDFILLFDKNEWELMPEAKKRAVVDHELCHCARGKDDKDGDPTWTTRGHDVEEFAEVIERHGLYKYDVKKFGDVVRQLPLPMTGDTTVKGKAVNSTVEVS